MGRVWCEHLYCCIFNSRGRRRHYKMHFENILGHFMFFLNYRINIKNIHPRGSLCQTIVSNIPLLHDQFFELFSVQVLIQDYV